MISRLLLGAIGILALAGGLMALADLIHGVGSLFLNLCALVNALIISAAFLGCCFQRPD